MIINLTHGHTHNRYRRDGGDILFKGFDEDSGLVSLQMAGSCAGCPSSTVTLRRGWQCHALHFLKSRCFRWGGRSGDTLSNSLVIYVVLLWIHKRVSIYCLFSS